METNKEGAKNGFGEYNRADVVRIGGKDGKGGKGSGGVVRYNTTDERKDIVNADKTKGRSPHIGLAHELIHGWHAVNGKMKKMSTAFAEDPDNPPAQGNATGEKIHGEEFWTRQQENIIRKEQNVKPRANPIKLP